MANSRSLLSLIAQWHSRGSEDAATDALCFILTRSSSARRALSEFLADDCGPLPITKALSQQGISHGAFPDLVLHDYDDKVIAFVESKFWADLTGHQPVTYWQELPSDRPTLLLFLAPAYRFEAGWLWNELVKRLQDAGHELGPASTEAGLTSAQSKSGQRRLMLTSWESLLDAMAKRSKQDGDDQTYFEIAQLQGLAIDAIERDNPQRDEHLKLLIADAVKRLEQSGWANTDGLSVASGFNYFGVDKCDYHGRNLRLAGAFAWFGIDYTAAKLEDNPLWVSFQHDDSASVDSEAVRSSLGKLAEPGLKWRSKEVCVPIVLPVAADRESTLDAMISELERIAKLIDPDGPTYRQA